MAQLDKLLKGNPNEPFKSELTVTVLQLLLYLLNYRRNLTSNVTQVC
jgi:hypothetical protein